MRESRCAKLRNKCLVVWRARVPTIKKTDAKKKTKRTNEENETRCARFGEERECGVGKNRRDLGRNAWHAKKQNNGLDATGVLSERRNERSRHRHDVPNELGHPLTYLPSHAEKSSSA